MNSIFSGTMSHKFSILFFILMLFISGCGSSGSSEGCADDQGCKDAADLGDMPQIADFAGTYDLQAFTIVDETADMSIDESNVANWCGRMVITSDGMIMYDQTIDNNTGNYQWEILEVARGAFKIKEGLCEAWVDYIAVGDSFTIIWPEGPCMDGYTMTLNTAKSSNSEVYPTEACTLTQVREVPEFSGSYEVTQFTYTDMTDGASLTQDDVVSWSGQMITTTASVIDFTLTLEGRIYHSEWEIFEIDHENNKIRVSDKDACEEWVDFQYLDEAGTLTLTWSGSGCTNGTAMTFSFAKIDEAVASMNKIVMNLSNGVEEDSNIGAIAEAL